jgi:PAS domain S-box-containing protein
MPDGTDSPRGRDRSNLGAPSGQSAQELAALLEIVPAYVLISHDAQGQRITGNRAACELLGAAPGSNLAPQLAGGPLAREGSPLQRALRTGQPQRDLELELQLSDGRHRQLVASAQALFDADGAVRGAVATLSDVTARRRAERAEHEAEARLAAFFEHSPAIMFVKDADGRYQLVSRSCAELAAASGVDGSLLGRTDAEILPPELAQAFRRDDLGVMQSGRAKTYEETAVLGGQRRTGLATKFPLRDPSGQVYAVGAINLDITDRVRTEEALKATAERLNLALAATELGDWSWDAASDMVTLSQRAADLFGIPPGPVLTWTALQQLLHIEDRERARLAVERAVVQQSRYDVEYRISRADGRQVWVAAMGRTSYDTDGRPLGMFGVVQDITERKQLEAALRDSEARFRGLMEQAPFSIQIFSPDGRPLHGNRAWEEMWGVTIEHLADYNILADPQLEAHGVLPALRRAFAGEAVELPAILYALDQTLPGRSRHPNPRRWVTVVAYPLRDPDGRVREVVLVHQDITERHRAAEALREADRRKNEFLATLAHELRNPLAPIRNAVELLKLAESEEGDERVAGAATRQAALDVIDRQLRHTVRLVDDLLDVSRITRGRLELRRERVELAAIIEQALETSRPHIERARHQLVVSLPRQPVSLSADPVRLAQVFANLLNNASKYTERGGRITLTAEREDSDVVVRVRDTGIGISAAHLPRLFEMFSQVDSALDRSQGGLGIGLSLARGLVELHGGSISAHSDGPGQGSEFTVRLPVLAAEAGAEPADPVPRGAHEPAPAQVRRRILIVDDNHDSARSLATLLRRFGNDVELAHDGLAAIEAAERYQPDAVLMDLGMPKLDGYAACRRIRQQPWGEGMLLIAQTGWGGESDRQRAREAGFDGHLVKPVDLRALNALLAQHPAQR